MYIGYAQFIMVLLIFLNPYKETKFGIWIFSHIWAMIALLVVIFGIFIVIGWLDKKYIRGKEQVELMKTNTIQMDMYLSLIHI